MDLKSSFGERLKHYRKQKHLSQEQLSEKADISVKHLSAIERGLNFVSAELLEKLSASLEIPVFMFFIMEGEIFYNDVQLDLIDRIIHKHLTKSMEDIRADIRQTG
jgi:transcriptional regulator with XRE-family HTH domain